MNLIAFDLDGTTLINPTTLSEENRNAILTAAERGIIVVPATGRLRTFIPQALIEIPAIRYIISSNGAALYDKLLDREIYRQPLSNKKAVKVQEILADYNLYMEYYDNGEAYTLKGNAENPEKFGIPDDRIIFTKKKYRFINDEMSFLKGSGIEPQKINIPYVKPEIYHKVYQRLIELGGLFLTSSLPGNLEINSDKANKADALRKLCELLDVKRENVMAIGDNENDAPMLEFAGYSVAMGNAAGEIKDKAQYVTDTCENSGMSKAVYKYLEYIKK